MKYDMRFRYRDPSESDTLPLMKPGDAASNVEQTNSDMKIINQALIRFDLITFSSLQAVRRDRMLNASECTGIKCVRFLSIRIRGG
jgi:hypothetical protein